jgi:hypothetical protein
VMGSASSGVQMDSVRVPVGRRRVVGGWPQVNPGVLQSPGMGQVPE